MAPSWSARQLHGHSHLKTVGRYPKCPTRIPSFRIRNTHDVRSTRVEKRNPAWRQSFCIAAYVHTSHSPPLAALTNMYRTFSQNAMIGALSRQHHTCLSGWWSSLPTIIALLRRAALFCEFHPSMQLSVLSRLSRNGSHCTFINSVGLALTHSRCLRCLLSPILPSVSTFPGQRLDCWFFFASVSLLVDEIGCPLRDVRILFPFVERLLPTSSCASSQGLRPVRTHVPLIPVP